ncbi:MAG: hypothetical protein GC134_03610 [Proteobacteria bacterium]|nr:hypothetical protein [Pseudomonadota bacterium]
MRHQLGQNRPQVVALEGGVVVVDPQARLAGFLAGEKGMQPIAQQIGIEGKSTDVRHDTLRTGSGS